MTQSTKNSLRNMIFMPSEGVFLPGLSFFMDVFQTVKNRFCPIPAIILHQRKKSRHLHHSSQTWQVL